MLTFNCIYDVPPPTYSKINLSFFLTYIVSKQCVLGMYSGHFYRKKFT